MWGKANHGTPIKLMLWVVLVALVLGVLSILSSPGAPTGIRCKVDLKRDFGCTVEHQKDADAR
jgi:hypothetical protein